MFLGEYKHTLDDKGRIFIPARFRAREKECFYVTRGLDTCLFVFPLDVWAAQQERINNMDMMKKDARAFNRLFFSGAAEAACDKQGRINLPANLIEYAHLTKEAMIIGVSDRFEIWSVDIWKEYEEEVAGRFEEIAESLVEKKSGEV